MDDEGRRVRLVAGMSQNSGYVVSDLGCGGDGLLPGKHTLLDIEEEEDAIVRSRHCWRDRLAGVVVDDGERKAAGRRGAKRSQPRGRCLALVLLGTGDSTAGRPPHVTSLHSSL